MTSARASQVLEPPFRPRPMRHEAPTEARRHPNRPKAVAMRPSVCVSCSFGASNTLRAHHPAHFLSQSSVLDEAVQRSPHLTSPSLVSDPHEFFATHVGSLATSSTSVTKSCSSSSSSLLVFGGALDMKVSVCLGYSTRFVLVGKPRSQRDGIHEDE